MDKIRVYNPILPQASIKTRPVGVNIPTLIWDEASKTSKARAFKTYSVHPVCVDVLENAATDLFTLVDLVGENNPLEVRTLTAYATSQAIGRTTVKKGHTVNVETNFNQEEWQKLIEKNKSYENKIKVLEEELDSLKFETFAKISQSYTLPKEKKDYSYDFYFTEFLFEPLREFLENFHLFQIEKQSISPSSASLKLTNRFISSLLIGIQKLIIGKSGTFHIPDLFTISRKGSQLEILPDKNLQSHLEKFNFPENEK